MKLLYEFSISLAKVMSFSSKASSIVKSMSSYSQTKASNFLIELCKLLSSLDIFCASSVSSQKLGSKVCFSSSTTLCFKPAMSKRVPHFCELWLKINKLGFYAFYQIITFTFYFLPQQCLCFKPLPQGQGSLRPTFVSFRFDGCFILDVSLFVASGLDTCCLCCGCASIFI